MAHRAARERASAGARLAALLPVLACLGIAGCGEAMPGRPVGSTATAPRSASVGTGDEASGVPAHARSVVARIDASSDRIVAEGKLHIAAGAPSDAEIRHEIEEARKAGVPLPSGDSASSFENPQPSSSGGPVLIRNTASSLESALQADRRLDHPDSAVGVRPRLERNRHERIPDLLRTGPAERRGRLQRAGGGQQP